MHGGSTGDCSRQTEADTCCSGHDHAHGGHAHDRRAHGNDRKHLHAGQQATPACSTLDGGPGGGGACGCESTVINFDGTDPAYIRRLWMVIAINGSMFLVEMLGGFIARSQALKADALDFLGDTLTYGLSLAVIGKPLRLRSAVAVIKGVSLLLMGLWVLGATLYATLLLKVPLAPVMGSIAMLALAANVASVLLLLPYKDGDANVRSVWLCSRNDAIGNIAVLGASWLVWLTASPWPDIAVAFVMAGLFTHSATRILLQARAEYRAAKPA